MSRRGGLGRGLAALIPTSNSSAAALATPERIDEARDAAELAEPDVVRWTGSGDDHTRGGSPDLLEQLGFDMGSPDVTDDSDRPAAEWFADAAGADADDSADVGDVADVPGLTLREIRLSDVVPNPQQPRQSFDEDALAELAHSIREFGLLQPIVVRPLQAGGYQLVMGERRLRAAGLAGLETVTALVRDTADDALLRDALLENIHRVALNPLEEAAAYDQLLAEFGVTHEELAARLGRSRSQITNTIRLLRLPVPVQRRVAAGVLSAGHARALLGLADGSAQEALATRIVAEGLSVRATEELVSTASATPARPRVSRAGRISAPGVEDLADRLSEAYDTRVRVEIGRRKGRIVVEFGSIDDLERIVSLMHSPVSSDMPALSR